MGSTAIEATHEIVTVRQRVTFLDSRKRGIPTRPGVWPESEDSRVDVWLARGASPDHGGSARPLNPPVMRDLWLDAEGETWSVVKVSGVRPYGSRIIRKDRFRGVEATNWVDDCRSLYRHDATDEEFGTAVAIVLASEEYRGGAAVAVADPARRLLPSGLRADGAYCHEGETLRFHPDGRVVGIHGSIWDAYTPRPTNPQSRGRVSEYAGEIQFSLRSDGGAVAYRGRVSTDGDLIVGWLSYLNGNRGRDTLYRFTPPPYTSS